MRTENGIYSAAKAPAVLRAALVLLHPIPLHPGVLEPAQNLPLSLQRYPSSGLDGTGMAQTDWAQDKVLDSHRDLLRKTGGILAIQFQLPSQ